MGTSFIFLSPLQISVILCLPRNTPSTRKSIVHLFESFTKVPLWHGSYLLQVHILRWVGGYRYSYITIGSGLQQELFSVQLYQLR